MALSDKSTLSFEKITLPMAPLGEENSLPPIAAMLNGQQQKNSALDEDDEVFTGYGFLNNFFPYPMQDGYGRTLEDTPLPCAVLENQYLKAVFLPSLGGRLYSLFDKEAGKELLFCNPVIQPGNLAVRNAWFSGGVEWNCGMVGHHPFTCEPMFSTSLTLEDGTPVLRMYQFERIRCVTYQMDFFLPENSRLLYCRMRIVNPQREVVPMYWWSNIAVPEWEKGRVVVDADAAYSNTGSSVIKVPVPEYEGTDITYPTNLKAAVDYFWKVPAEKRKYVCHLGRDGYGLIQTSTRRLRGRKLFVWGQGKGGSHWQKFLSGKGAPGRYVEIQAGLAQTQYECLPMPPHTAWEWMEAYGAMQADKTKVHGEWNQARQEVLRALDTMLPEQELEALLTRTKPMALCKGGALYTCGDGWGALEEARRSYMGEPPLSEHLNFGGMGPRQLSWSYLLQNGYFPEYKPEDIPCSWMRQKEWMTTMEKAAGGAGAFDWYGRLQLGMSYLAEERLEEAESELACSIRLTPSCWALYGLAQVAANRGELEKAALLCLRAARMRPGDVSLAKEAMRLMLDASLHSIMFSYAGEVPENVRKNGRFQLYLAYALLREGRIDEASSLIEKAGGLVVPDVREGEKSLTELWISLQRAKAEQEGRTINEALLCPPEEWEYRGNV